MQQAAQAMIAAAEQGRPVQPVLKQHCPHIVRQIVRDAAAPGLLARWGRSLNVDDNVGQTIVHPAILQAISELAGIPLRGRIVHAGLQHTYGYLFSLMETPYGFKRDRWVSDGIERGLGIDPSLLSDHPTEGTLLANLTWLMDRIAQGPGCVRLPPPGWPVAQELLAYDFGRLHVDRLVEKVTLPEAKGRALCIHTGLVVFPQRPQRADNAFLLVYSLQNGAQAKTKLVTAFPIMAQVARDLKVVGQGRGPVRLRYNAYVRGFLGKEMVGRRKVMPGTTP